MVAPHHTLALADLVANAVAAGFAGVVRVDEAGTVRYESAHGWADRAHEIPITASSRFAIASGTKGFTALAVMRLVEQGALSLATPAAEVLGDELPRLAPEMTVRHLLAHRSGLGEYCHEVGASAVADGALAPAPGLVDTPAALLPMFADLAPLASPDTEFRYNNTGYVVLARIAERVTGAAYADLLADLVIGPAGLTATALLRYDELPGDAATGYLDAAGLRTNVHHVPVRGVGDGGLFTNVADMVRVWSALFAGRIVRPDTLRAMTTANGYTAGGTPYGLGFWLDRSTDAVELEGADFGISFRSVHQPSSAVTWTVVSNTTDGAWLLADQLGALLGTSTIGPAS
jgi:CubicO group peptidase (beta-lactamase class C family)